MLACDLARRNAEPPVGSQRGDEFAQPQFLDAARRVDEQIARRLQPPNGRSSGGVRILDDQTVRVADRLARPGAGVRRSGRTPRRGDPRARERRLGNASASRPSTSAATERSSAAVIMVCPSRPWNRTWNDGSAGSPGVGRLPVRRAARARWRGHRRTAARLRRPRPQTKREARIRAISIRRRSRLLLGAGSAVVARRRRRFGARLGRHGRRLRRLRVSLRPLVRNGRESRQLSGRGVARRFHRRPGPAGLEALDGGLRQGSEATVDRSRALARPTQSVLDRPHACRAVRCV